MSTITSHAARALRAISGPTRGRSARRADQQHVGRVRIRAVGLGQDDLVLLEAGEAQEVPRLRTAMRDKGFAICVNNQGAEDLDIRKVYRVLPDKTAADEGYLRVIDESGDDYLYPVDYFVFLELPRKAKRAWAAGGRRAAGPA